MNPKVTRTKNRIPDPLGDIIVVKPHVEEVSSGGILIPKHTAQGIKKVRSDVEVFQGDVLAYGLGVFTDAGAQIPIPVKIGDTIIYLSNGVVEYKLDGETYHLITVAGLLARLIDGPYT